MNTLKASQGKLQQLRIAKPVTVEGVQYKSIASALRHYGADTGSSLARDVSELIRDGADHDRAFAQVILTHKRRQAANA